MRKILVLLTIILILIVGCSDQQTSFDIEVGGSEISWPFTDIDNGKIILLFRNSSDYDFNMKLVWLGDQIMLNKNEFDFCPQLELMKSNNIPNTWTLFTDINLFKQENVPNENDHPNIVSYSLPLGSYVVFFDKFEKCNKDSYITFDVNTMDAFDQFKE